ncbi:hypothetical protein GQX74_011834 [Glossina fuscipes]|nr:hypothetical protein GQX74_011834 [Glossina fuscipes]
MNTVIWLKKGKANDIQEELIFCQTKSWLTADNILLKGATSAATATPSTVNITTTATTATATTAIINGYSTTVVTIAIAISITSTISCVRPVNVTNTIIIAVTITYSANHSDSDNIQEHSNRATSKTILRFDSIHSSDGFCNKNISILLRLLSSMN